jgi:hypothetical protein
VTTISVSASPRSLFKFHVSLQKSKAPGTSGVLAIGYMWNGSLLKPPICMCNELGSSPGVCKNYFMRCSSRLAALPTISCRLSLCSKGLVPPLEGRVLLDNNHVLFGIMIGSVLIDEAQRKRACHLEECRVLWNGVPVMLF